MQNGDFIELLLSQNEGGRLRLSPEWKKDELLKVICAYLNGQGGWIIVGMNETRVTVGTRGVSIQQIYADIMNEISPQPLVYIQPEMYDCKEVFLITVMQGSRAPYSYAGSFFTSMADGCIVVPDKDAIRALMRSYDGFASSWETIAATGVELENLDENLMSQVYSLGRESCLISASVDSPYAMLSRCGLLDFGIVKNGAVALFATETNRLMRQCRCRIQLMMNGKTSQQFEDMVVYEGNLFQLIDQIHDYFLNRLPVVSRFSDQEWGRNQKSLYPMNVLDEAVVNALVHRDMGDLSGEVVINVYKDRMEIINSGVMPDGIVKGKNTIKPHVSVLRNPVMAEILHYAGKMEKTGRGLMLIYQQMKENGMKLPEWKCENGYTVLTIYSTPLVVKLSPRSVQFLSNFGEKTFTRSMYEGYFHGDISEKTAKNDISAMVKGGWLIQEGKGPSTMYVKTGKSLPDFA